MDYKIGYAASVAEKCIEDTLDYAGQNGYKAVELNMNMPCFFPENYDQERIEEIRRIKEEKKIEVTMHAPEDISLVNFHEGVLNAGLERLEEIIDFAGEIGASRITVHAGSTPYFTGLEKKYYVQDECIERAKYILKRSLRRIVSYASAKGVMICMENSGHFPKNLVQDTIQEVIDEGRDVYLTWDIGHSYENKYGEVAFFQKNIDKVKTVHLHDFCRDTKRDHRVIGSGSVEFERHMKLIGNEAVYIIEVRPKEAALESYENLLRLVEKGQLV